MKRLPDRQPNERAAAGFTLVELLVVMIITVAMTIAIISFTFDYWGSVGTLVNDHATFVERENAGDRLRSLLNVGAKLINQNSIGDSNVSIPDPSDSTGKFWLLIHAIPENIPMPAAGSYTPVFYFDAPSVTSSKSFIMNGSQPYYDEFMLYLNGSTNQLLVRQLVNPGATGDYLTTSCPASAASSSCPVDVAISGDIASVDVNYYSKSGNVINYTSSVDPVTNQYNGPDFPTVEVVQLTLHFSRSATIKGSANSLNQTVVRVALRN